MDLLWSETFWSTFKYFIILIVSTYYILCISWILKCLITCPMFKSRHWTRDRYFLLYRRIPSSHQSGTQSRNCHDVFSSKHRLAGASLSICTDISGANHKNKHRRSCGVIAIRVQHVTSAFQLAVCCWHSRRWLTTFAILSNRRRASSAGCLLSVHAPSSSCSVPNGRNREPVLALSVQLLGNRLEIGRSEFDSWQSVPFRG